MRNKKPTNTVFVELFRGIKPRHMERVKDEELYVRENEMTDLPIDLPIDSETLSRV